MEDITNTRMHTHTQKLRGVVRSYLADSKSAESAGWSKVIGFKVLSQQVWFQDIAQELEDITNTHTHTAHKAHTKTQPNRTNARHT